MLAGTILTSAVGAGLFALYFAIEWRRGGEFGGVSALFALGFGVITIAFSVASVFLSRWAQRMCREP